MYKQIHQHQHQMYTNHRQQQQQQQQGNNKKPHRRPLRQSQIKFNMQNTYQSLYTKECPRLESLTCVFCKQKKPTKEFSEMQIAKATYNLYAPSLANNNSHCISCLKCTDTQRKTLTCWKCSKNKPLNQFSKAQRRWGDEARCMECMRKRDEEDVNDSEPSDSSDESDEWDVYL